MSATLFLSRPDEYDGGELVIEDNFGAHQVKLPAGDMIVYPAHSVHRVEPITRGARIGSFFWVQSLVRDDNQRAILFELDSSIQRLSSSGTPDAIRRSLVGVYHNLLRTWTDT